MWPNLFENSESKYNIWMSPNSILIQTNSLICVGPWGIVLSCPFPIQFLINSWLKRRLEYKKSMSARDDLKKYDSTSLTGCLRFPTCCPKTTTPSLNVARFSRAVKLTGRAGIKWKRNNLHRVQRWRAGEEQSAHHSRCSNNNSHKSTTRSALLCACVSQENIVCASSGPILHPVCPRGWTSQPTLHVSF